MIARLLADLRRSALAIALLAAILPVAAACGSPVAQAPSTAPSVPPAPAFPLTVTDDEGTEVTLVAEPARIASLTPAATETLFALGLGDRIVARSEDPVLYPEAAAAIPEVARFDGVDVERLVSLEPDLVIAGGNFFTPPDAVAQLRTAGVPVLVVYAPTVAAVSDDIELIGRAAGREAEAEAIGDRIEAEFAGVGEAVAGLPTPRVFYELDATGAIYGPADESFLAEMIRIAGGDPVTTGSPDKYDIPIERLIEADPEVILLADAPYGVTAEAVAARPGWAVMTAVENRDIRPIDDAMITRPGPRIFLGLQQLAAAIHPDAAVPSSSPIPAVP